MFVFHYTIPYRIGHHCRRRPPVFKNEKIKTAAVIFYVFLNFPNTQSFCVLKFSTAEKDKKKWKKLTSSQQYVLSPFMRFPFITFKI